MIFAALYGIKLTEWSLKRELFDSIFNEFNLTPIERSKSDDGLVCFEEGHFLNFYTMNDYSISVENLLNDDEYYKALNILSS